ncbi:polysaccharide deacetylase family protein [Aquabacter spiritensis]|uniref:Chitooligosaccharide deacetylase n=1 Tax=Aquabacter spiritensis TaxID=933073 RepID=A0A4R3M4R6_9HYPH|nr:polysaccharide deacetylase [Aquabacter spiritensis]TCT07846.1 polysaccharide deacetylase [Aquabacter spiritensis]
MARHLVCLTFDFDVVSGWIARGMTTPTPMSRGEMGLIGAKRILALLAKHNIRSTWFVPGHTIESFPDAAKEVVDAGHEIANHSWAHIPPAMMTREEEEADLVRASEAIIRLTGKAPRGYRSASWDLSPHTIDLLVKHGFKYESSLMGSDYVPYRARRDDVVKLGEPMILGPETDLVELPISWTLDDYPHFEFVRTPATILPGLQSADGVLRNWTDDFLYMKRDFEWGVITYTCHPFVIGRGHRMIMLERLVETLVSEGATFCAMEDAMEEFLARERRAG